MDSGDIRVQSFEFEGSEAGVRTLKSERKSYLVVPCILGVSLLAGAAGTWCWGVLGEGSVLSGGVAVAIAVACAVFAWLHWCILAARIASLAAVFGSSDKSRASKFSFLRVGSAVNKLLGSIEDHAAGDARAEEVKKQQVQNLKMQVRLSGRQKRNTEAIIYSIRDAVIVVDESDRLLMANEAAGRLFDFDFLQVQHKAVDEVIDGDKSGFASFLKGCRKSRGRATRQEIEFAQDAGARTYDCIVSCVYDEQEKVCGVVAVLHDITREKEISQMKNDFVSHVSHELKTPLASITAYSEMLVDGEAGTEETRKEFYSVIQNQAQRLNRLIEDILNISRIESGLIKIDKRPISLTILIEEQLRMIKSYAEEKGIEVISQKPIVFDQVNVDKDMLSQVVVNLLSNAVKYTPAGGSVRVSTEVDEISKMVCVRVTDTGIGIPDEEIEHVFDKFYRVGVNNKQAKGTGLGLNLVKQIVEKVHNGRVFVNSKRGQGSTFGFELPLATTESVEVG